MEDLLRELAEKNPELESILVVDEEGIIVYRYDKEDTTVDPEEIATQLVNPLNAISESIRDLSGEEDDLEELVLFTKKHQIFVYKLVNETYLVAIAKRDPLYGRLRFRLKSQLPEFIKTL